MDFKIKEKYEMQDLVQIVRLLRDKDHGCPWDKEQTHLSIRKNFIEETYEAIEAIDLDDKKMMQEELGDVLLQIILHSQFEAEENVFDFGEVVNGVCQKLVLRHPHIFKELENKTVDGVLLKWEEIKKQEKGQVSATDTLDAVCKSFPALMYAQKLQKRAVAAELICLDKTKIISDLQQNLDNLKASACDDKMLQKQVSDMLFTLVGLCVAQKLDAEELLSLKNSEKLDFFKNLDK